jgi:serine/threonine-protein phosphatase 2A regulatory subunit A
MMPLIIQAQEDRSWRVRLSLAKNLSEIAEAFGKDITDLNLVQIFSNILKDPENDVRAESVRSLVKFVKIVSSEKLNILLNHIANLCKDTMAQVRYGAADVIINVAGIVPKDVAVKLLPCLMAMISDDNQEVRQRGIHGACKFAEIQGIESISSIIQVFSRQMVEDKKWRVRY